MTPNDVHVGEWVFAENNGKKDLVKIMAVYDNQVVAANHNLGSYGYFKFNKLSPIPFNEETVKLFDWSKVTKFSVQQNRETKQVYVRYINEKNELKKYYKLLFIHELQQWAYRIFKTPLVLETL